MNQDGRVIVTDTGMSEFCSAMIDTAPMPMVFVEGHDHVIRYVNPAFCFLIGEPECDLIGCTFSHAVCESSELLSLLDRVHRTGQTETHVGQDNAVANPFCWSYVMWSIRSADPGGTGIIIQVTETTPFHHQAIALNQALIIGSVRQHELTESAEALNALLQAEILQRQQAEQEVEIQQRALQASELQYRKLIEAIPQIVWTATPQGTLDFVNSKWFEYLGIDLDSFNWAGWQALLHPDDKDRSLREWSAGLKSLSAFQIEHRLRNVSGGSFRWYLSRAVPIGTEAGQIEKWFGTSTDIEDQKRAETALLNKQKLESLGLLAGGIAHDFNNLLVPILGGASFVIDTLPSSHPLQEILANIVRAGESAAHLTRQMLAYAGKGQFVIQLVDMGEVIRSACDLVKASIPNSVQLTLQTGKGLLMVEADPGQMQQVVMNLVLNAVEAIDKSTSGSVTLKTYPLEITASQIETIEPVLGSVIPKLYVVLEVQDTGSGMDEATKAKIFDPFFTTKFTGRGLGLSALEGILRTQQGALEVQSEIGHGSTFRVFLPASLRRKHAQVPVARSPQQSRRGTVLVVDDEEMIRQLAKVGLEASGVSVRVAAGGAEALAILRETLESPIALIVLDLSMPGMSGKQFMQQLVLLGIELPVLVCSGFSEDEVYQEFSGLRIAGFIPKPFTFRQLSDRVANVLNTN